MASAKKPVMKAKKAGKKDGAKLASILVPVKKMKMSKPDKKKK